MNLIRYIILGLYFITNSVYGQSFKVLSSGNGELYPRVENRIQITTDNNECKNLYIKSNNGKIEKSININSKCEYIFTPSRIGRAKLEVYTLKNGDTILTDSKDFIINRWPRLKAIFANVESGNVTLGMFLAQGRVEIPTMGFGYCGNVAVHSYKVRILRNGVVKLNCENKGERLEEKNYQLLENVKVGDEVFFEDIMTIMPGESSLTKVNEIRIKIVEK